MRNSRQGAITGVYLHLPMNRMLSLADRHRLTAYDAAYLELALSRAAELASLDDDLVKAARAEGLTVRSPF